MVGEAVMKRIVINGPTGAIGMALIEKCIKEKIEVLAICRRGSTRMGNIPKSKYIKVIECNLSEIINLKYEGGFEVFYHLAWEGTTGEARNDVYLQNKNVQYTLDAVHLANRLGCHTFIGAGSQAEYGRFEGKLESTTPTFPENGYGMAKLCAGQMSKVLCKQLGIKNIWVRILSVYGPYDNMNTMIMSTIDNLLNGLKPVFTKGEQMWDYLYSGDAAEALYLIGIRGKNGKVYCLGSGKARPLYEYINKIRDSVNPNLTIGLGEIPYNENQIMHLWADIEDLKLDVGFFPTVNFSNGIKKTIKTLMN
ncbi:NAD(P)-dependent oxidoreductase [Lysinibacillus louembei]|uniref:NAD(P)-dependent oxidoreductase n=1 Tax=Lysinibacillus louembei TaxID=1470088 RepID=A0ABZ0S472_9BACI|nr:NAD(P)-dependent oxidoreductase [Lysinibacillus louembei]WPK12392.1 NAD(P)-dependent oxidoreductase [Lysinibacillus louembei]